MSFMRRIFPVAVTATALTAATLLAPSVAVAEPRPPTGSTTEVVDCVWSDGSGVSYVTITTTPSKRKPGRVRIESIVVSNQGQKATGLVATSRQDPVRWTVLSKFRVNDGQVRTVKISKKKREVPAGNLIAVNLASVKDLDISCSAQTTV